MPAENTPAGRKPGIFSAPRERSRQPLAKMSAPADRRDDLFRGNTQNHCAELVRDMQSLCAFFKARGVLRTRELLFKRVQTEAVVDALV